MNRRELLRLLGLAPLASGLAPLGDIAGASQSGQAPRAFTGTPDVELSLTAARGELNLLPGAPTRVWRFTGKVQHGPESALQVIPGSYLGPVIRLLHEVLHDPVTDRNTYSDAVHYVIEDFRCALRS